jgi:hypothetical protein
MLYNDEIRRTTTQVQVVSRMKLLSLSLFALMAKKKPTHTL